MKPVPRSIADFESSGLAQLADADQLILAFGPFQVRLRTRIGELLQPLRQLYGATPVLAADSLLDYDILVTPPRNVRRWFRPQIQFEIDGLQPFDPHPLENAFPMFEWGLNWCIATSTHQHLMLHSAVIAWDDRALIMPGEPGSGKSTLCAALTLSNARLLCDEFGLVDIDALELDPIPRAIPLKNASVPVIEAFAPDANLGPVYPKTRKGRIRHLAPGTFSLEQQHRRAQPNWIVFPKYAAGGGNRLQPVRGVEAFQRLAFNCFNYRLHGAAGFSTVDALVRRCGCYTLEFNDLQAAIDRLTELKDTANASAL